MGKDRLNEIREIDLLWQGVYPYLARHVASVYHRENGLILEIGPFCGVIFELARAGVGSSFLAATFPQGMGTFVAGEALRRGLREKVAIIETDEKVSALADNSVDCAIFRGALFFPSLFRTDFRAIRRILASGGVAFVGGGFGRQTPSSVIEPIQERSRLLNLALGKVNITAEQVEEDLAKAGLEKEASVTTDGGLWVILRKP